MPLTWHWFHERDCEEDSTGGVDGSGSPMTPSEVSIDDDDNTGDGNGGGCGSAGVCASQASTRQDKTSDCVIVKFVESRTDAWITKSHSP